MENKKNWIKNAIKKPGGLHEMLGISKDKKIPSKKLLEATKSSNTLLKKRAILAKTLAGFKK